MSHLGQQLSAFVDGELTGAERDRVVRHVFLCSWCRDEAAALRALKQRMNALGEAAAGVGLTDRLIDLSMEGDCPWPRPAAGWHFGAHSARPEARTGKYLLVSSVALFLAGLGTAAFIAGGEPQARAPVPQVTPQVGVFTVEHDNMNGLYMNELTQRQPLQSAGASFGQDQSASRRQP